MTLDSYQNGVKNLQSNLLNYAFILTSDRRSAYQLLQDTTSAILSRREDFTGEQSLKDWAFSTMHHICIKKYPRIIRPVHVGGTSPRIVVGEVHETECEKCNWLVEEKAVTAEIFAINDADAAACIKLHVKGYTLNEIAGRRGTTAATITGNLFSALGNLISRLYA